MSFISKAQRLIGVLWIVVALRTSAKSAQHESGLVASKKQFAIF